MPELDGKIIDGYRVDQVLGHGGMGVVYKAHDLRLGRDVAMKMIDRRYAVDEEALERFRSEAKALARLQNPHIVTIYTLSETASGIFIVMECVKGVTLHEVLRREGALHLERVLKIIGGLLDALDHAHKAGVVHRDIKPTNILVSEGDLVKVTDFGLAKLTGVKSLTKTGTTLGTAGYMSPEQVRGEEIDYRTDIWSVGVVFYEMLTGRLPFRGESDVARTYSIVHEDSVPMAHYRPDLTDSFENIIRRCLEKEGRNRFQNVAELQAALEGVVEWASEASTKTINVRAPVVQAPTPHNSKKGWAIGVLVAIVVGLVIALSQFPRLLPGVESTSEDDTSHSAKVVGDSSSTDQNIVQTESFAIRTPEDLAASLIALLRDGDSSSDMSVLVSPFTYQDTKLGGSFSGYLKRLLENRASVSTSWSIVQQILDVDEGGVSIEGTLAGTSAASHRLTGTYWGLGNRYKFLASLQRIPDSRIMGSAELYVDANVIESTELSLKPGNLSQALEDQQLFTKDEINKSELNVKAWTNKGRENLLFVEGEKMKLYLNLNRPSYVRVIYHLANGRRTLLLDNEYVDETKVNTSYKIPVEFQCDSPFGAEVLQVFAQSERFLSVKTIEQDGYVFVVDDLETFLFSTRGMKRTKRDVLQAEDRIQLTTIENIETTLGL